MDDATKLASIETALAMLHTSTLKAIKEHESSGIKLPEFSGYLRGELSVIKSLQEAYFG